MGLRPGEMLQLTPEDVRAALEADRSHLVIIRLGHAVSTKVRREQFALLDVRVHSGFYQSLKLAIDLTPPFQKIFPFTIQTYNYWLKKVQESLALPLGVSAHSGRAGFVSDNVALGRPQATIRAEGRWHSEASFRIYVDVVGSLHAGQAAHTAGYASAIYWIIGNEAAYFNPISLDVYRIRDGPAGGDITAAEAATADGRQSVAGHVSRGRGMATGRGRAGRGA